MNQPSPQVIHTSRRGLFLRRFIPADHDWQLMARWLSDPRVLEWYEGRDKPYDFEKAASEYSAEEIAAEHLDCRIIELNGRPIGYLQCYPVAKAEDYELDTAEDTWAMDLFIGEPDFWEQGLGTDVVKGMVDYLLSEGARRIVIDPRVENPRAIRTYEKAGFRKVKVLKEHEEHEGGMRDCWLMEVAAKA